MGIIAAAVSVIMAAAIVLLLAVIRSGTRRQQKAGTLACRAPGRTAGLARRVTGLYAEPQRGRR